MRFQFDMEQIICMGHHRQRFVSQEVDPTSLWYSKMLLNINFFLDETSGTSVDWFYDKLDIKITYTFEFRDRRGGYYGFLLPSNQIIPNCLEIMDGMIAFVNRARILHKV